MEVVAINIEPAFSLEQWIEFWKSKGADDVVWVQDPRQSTIEKFGLVVLGTEVIVDRQGRVAFRSDGPARYKKLRDEIEKLL